MFSTTFKRFLHPNGHSSTIYNNQDAETMSCGRGECSMQMEQEEGSRPPPPAHGGLPSHPHRVALLLVSTPPKASPSQLLDGFLFFLGKAN